MIFENFSQSATQENSTRTKIMGVSTELIVWTRWATQAKMMSFWGTRTTTLRQKAATWAVWDNLLKKWPPKTKKSRNTMLEIKLSITQVLLQVCPMMISRTTSRPKTTSGCSHRETVLPLRTSSRRWSSSSGANLTCSKETTPKTDFAKLTLQSSGYTTSFHFLLPKLIKTRLSHFKASPTK